MSTSYAPPPCSPLQFGPMQLEQRFPPVSPSAAQPQHCINLGKHYLNDLCFYTPSPPAATMRTYPLIIRLEALQEGHTQGRSLEGLPPGCELPQWVQSQVCTSVCARVANVWLTAGLAVSLHACVRGCLQAQLSACVPVCMAACRCSCLPACLHAWLRAGAGVSLQNLPRSGLDSHKKDGNCVVDWQCARHFQAFSGVLWRLTLQAWQASNLSCTCRALVQDKQLRLLVVICR